MLNNETSDNRTMYVFLVCDFTLFPKFFLLRFFKNFLDKFNGKNNVIATKLFTTGVIQDM